MANVNHHANTALHHRVPGLLLPTDKPMIASTPRDSAIQQQKNVAEYQNRLIKPHKGGSRLKKRKTKNTKKRRQRKGGNRDWHWGCYSGGYNYSKKSRK